MGGHLKRPAHFLRAEMEPDRAARNALLALTSPSVMAVQ